MSREERVVRLSLGQKYYEKRAHALSVSCLQEDVDSSPYLYMRYPDNRTVQFRTPALAVSILSVA